MKYSHKLSFYLIALALAVSTRAVSATLVTIDWGSGAHGITGDSDVSMSGSLVKAFNLGALSVTAATVSGVTFGAFAIPTDGITQSVTMDGYTFAEFPSTLRSYSILGSATAPFVNLSGGYQTLLSSAGSSVDPNTVTLTIPSLTIGNAYLFQWWTNYSSSNDAGVRNTTGTGSITLNSNPGAVVGGLGQYAIGTFTASASTMAIEFDGPPLINAFQLRDVTAVPEPSSYAVFAGIGGLAIALLRRRKSLKSPAVPNRC
jgi:hypothetical protein